MDNWPKYTVKVKIKTKTILLCLAVFCLFPFNLHYDYTYQDNPFSIGCHMLIQPKQTLSVQHKIKDCR